MVLIDIKEKNFENLIYIHRNKLKRLKRGSNAFKLFTSKERNRLVSDNVLIKGLNDYVITKKALKVLDDS